MKKAIDFSSSVSGRSAFALLAVFRSAIGTRWKSSSIEMAEEG